jgi:hypothetical protein
MFSFPPLVHNISEAQCFNSSDCFHNETCGPTKATDAYNVCECDPYRDPVSRCQLTFFEVLDTSVLVYAGIGIVSYGIFFIAFVMELINDVRLYKTFKLPMLPKASMILFNGLRLAHFALWIHASLTGMVNLQPVYDAVLQTLGIVFLGSLGYLTMCVAWCDLLLKAKNVGVTSKRIRVIRIILLVACGAVTPVTTTLNIISSFTSKKSIMVNVSNALGGIVIAIALVTTTYLLVVVYRWIYGISQEEGFERSKRVAQVLQKTRWLIAINCILCITLAMVGLFSALPAELPYVTLLIQSIARTLELAADICMYGFLQSYLTANKIPFVGYFYAAIGRTGMLRELTSFVTVIHTSPVTQVNQSHPPTTSVASSSQ